MQVVVIAVGTVLVLLGYSWYELFTSRVEREDRRVDRFQLVLFSAVTLDLLWPFLFLLVPDLVGWVGWPRDTVQAKAMVILSGAVPLVAGGMVALCKGPARIAMPVACLLLVVYWSFAYYMEFIIVIDMP
jgi:hypothetical protein